MRIFDFFSYFLLFLLACDAGKIKIHIPFEDFKEITLNNNFPDSMGIRLRDTLYLVVKNAALVVSGDSTVKRGLIRFYSDSAKPYEKGDTVYIFSTSELVIPNSISLIIHADNSTIDVRVGNITGGEFHDSRIRGYARCKGKRMKFVNSIFTVMFTSPCILKIDPPEGAVVKEMLKVVEMKIYTIKIDSAHIQIVDGR